MKTKNKWVVKSEDGKILGKFRLKVTAQQNLSRLKLNKREKLEVIEVN